MKTRTQQPAGAVQQDFPPRLEVMLLHASKQPFTRDGWIFEPKLDGMRCIALIRDGGCRLYSRNWRNITEVFPGIAAALTQQGDFILDGELSEKTACTDRDSEARTG